MSVKRRTFFGSVILAFPLLVLVFGRGGQIARAADTRDSDLEAIRAVLSAQDVAWNRGDVEAFLGGCWHSPELTFSGSNGVSRGWDSVLCFGNCGKRNRLHFRMSIHHDRSSPSRPMWLRFVLDSDRSVRDGTTSVHWCGRFSGGRVR